jgi:hypothetical protein
MDDLQEYKNTLYDTASWDSEANEVFPEESFFEYVTELLSETGILDNVEYCPYRNSNRGIKIDGYSWNELEKTISGIVINFTNEPDVINTLINTEITTIGKRVSRFFESIQDSNFIDSLEVTDPGRIAAEEILKYCPEAIKFRIILITDQLLSVRVKKVQIEKILDIDTTIEIWDLERLMALDQSSSDHEEFTVDLVALGGGIKALPANTLENGVSTYLAVMPGNLLSNIYNEFGQRLLESNVRTFLDFRAGTNKGMRKSLLTEPENFFAYNNGLTVTASGIKQEIINGELIITELENMQIVNGGQTTAAIYFSPREKGGIQGEDKEYFFRDIDLNKVFVQMKLTVVGEKETADTMKDNIAKYANSQNSIQESDLESNHPFHLNIESRSRKQTMPAGEQGISTKWFYERARGQYSTLMRAMTGPKKRKFEMEYPKKQLFTKVDMAKYENTWRMLPHIVKKGAQANLKALGSVILKEYEKNEDQFGGAYYQSLVAKMILFRQSDTAIMQSDWYQADKGFKAETVTYTLALLRYLLIKQGKDINLNRIYQNQSISKTLSAFVVSLAERVRRNILDLGFRDGVANPSEFCKSEKGWIKFQQMSVDLSSLDEADMINKDQIQDRDEESKELNKVSKSISQLEEVMNTTAQEWELIAKFNAERNGPDHISVGIPKACILLLKTGKMLSEKQLKSAVEIKNKAYEEGFEYIS